MANQVFYEDEDTIVTAEALILQGERIPIRKIKRVSLERCAGCWLDGKIGREVAAEFSELKIELDGIWKKTREIRDFTENERLKEIRDAVMKAMAGKG